MKSLGPYGRLHNGFTIHICDFCSVILSILTCRMLGPLHLTGFLRSSNQLGLLNPLCLMQPYTSHRQTLFPEEILQIINIYVTRGESD